VERGDVQGNGPAYTIVSANSDGKAIVTNSDEDHKPIVAGGSSSK
jgi:hypothetical protein